MKRLSIMEYSAALKKVQLEERKTDGLVGTRISGHDEADLISLATQIQNADKHLKSGACQKLLLIIDQIKMLQAQALDILKETEENSALHKAACNFIKKPGQVYHLYRRSTGQTYFSMISQEEWNGSINQTYLGSYRLEFDQSWTPLEKTVERDNKIKWAEKCLETASLNSSMTPMTIDFNTAEQNS